MKRDGDRARRQCDGDSLPLSFFLSLSTFVFASRIDFFLRIHDDLLKHEIIDEEEEEEEEIHKRHKKILRVRCKIEIENGGGEGRRGR